jgi:hypothetical protein
VSRTDGNVQVVFHVEEGSRDVVSSLAIEGQLMNAIQFRFLAALLLVVATTSAHAQKGCFDSPEAKLRARIRLRKLANNRLKR